MLTTQASLDHVLHNGETLEFYWAVAGQENTGFNDYFTLMQDYLNCAEDKEKAREVFYRMNAHWCRHMNVLIDEIVHLTQGVKE